MPSTRRSVLIGAVLTASTIAARPAATARAAATTGRFTLPAPTGPFAVGTRTRHLVDTKRPDPWVPTEPVRQLMIQLWYPAETVRGHPRAPWMTPATARAYEQINGLPEFRWPLTHGHTNAPVKRGRWPMVLNSPGLGSPRADATSLVQDLASHGYVVVTIDHVHDASVVELPGGRLEYGALPPLTPENEVEVTTRAVESRVADTRFVLDHLDVRRVGMFGHSDGGATTAAAMHVDRRIAVGVNLDGTLWTPDSRAGSDRPLLLFGRETLDAHERETWDAYRGLKREIHLTGSTHRTFVDFALLLPQAAPALGLEPEQVRELLGTIDPVRAAAVLRVYLRAFLNQDPLPHYPEITSPDHAD